MVLSNGKMSPVFLAKGANPKALQKVDINLPVKKIRGTANTNDCVCQLHFHCANDKLLAKVEGKTQNGFGQD